MNRFDATTNRFDIGNSQVPVLDNTLKISQGAKQNTIEKLFNSIVEPITNFFTNTTPRERASVQIAAVTHQPQEQGFTSIKLPFINKQVPLQNNFLTDAVKNLVETPERFVQTIKESHDLATKGFVPAPDNGRLTVDSYLKVNSDFYNKARENGMGDLEARIVSGIYTVGQGTLDASIVGSLLEKAAIGTLDATASSVAKKQAWEVLGMPQTAEQAQKNYLELASKYHPDKGGEESIFKIINNANQVIKKEGIPSLVEQKAIPNIRQWAKQLLVEPGASIGTESVASPQVSGLLPGNAPVGGKPQPKLGLSIQPVESVGGGSKELQPLAQEARKYKSAEEFVRAQQQAFHGSPISDLQEISFGKGVRSNSFLGSSREVDSGAIFFTPDKEVANEFANNRVDWLKEAGKTGKATVYERYLNIKNPIDFTEKGIKNADKVIEKAGLTNYVEETLTGIQAFGQDLETLLDNKDVELSDLWKLADDKKIVSALRKQGIDGAIFNESGNRGTSYAIFNPKQAFTKSQLTDFYNQVTNEALQKETPQTVKPVMESPSPLGQAEQDLSKALGINRRDTYSLPKIIAQDVQNVKQKVNIIDYLRTPDRVLKKIGLGKEAQMLQDGYNSYIMELPKNIDKITQWAKQVPNSAETIFKYLDGQKIQLTPTELKVAGEIKDWLKEWAKRLDLPADRTITNYITHLFDKELIAKEFDEDLAKIITDKVPGSVYDPFLLKRLGAKGYKQNVWEALDAYVKRGTRKANMDEALSAIQRKVGDSLETSNMETSQWKYVQRYISGVNMRPTELDNLLDNSIKNLVDYKFGQRPVTYLTKVLRQMTYRGMLGLNLSSALKNMSQGVNTYATLGEKYTAIGYLKLFSKGAIQELTDEGVLANHFIQDRALSSTKKALEKIDKGLFAFFEVAEKINRGSAYFGAKAKALAEGKAPEEAVKFAKDTVRKTQFLFGSVDTPVALQSDIAKTIAQFQNYTLKQTEFLTEMMQDKNFMGILRYIVGGLAFVYTIGKAFGMKPEELLPMFRFDTPPSLKLPTQVGGAVLNTPDKYGNQRDLEKKANDIFKAGIGLVPAGSQINKTVGGIQSIQQGGSYTKNKKLQFKQDQSTLGQAQSVLFGKSASQNAQDYYNKKPKATTPKTNRFNK